MNHDRPWPSGTREACSSTVEAPPGSASVAVEQVAVPADLLDGGEVVLLAIKPSLWMVLFSSAQWICVAALVITLDWWFGRSISAGVHMPVIQIALAAAGLRLGVAMMQWVSRAYLLTNRRVMRIQGVIKADVFACPLVQVRGTRVTRGPHEVLTRLGTIRFNTNDDSARGCWHHIARPDEVHDEVRRAIERAIDRQA